MSRSTRTKWRSLLVFFVLLTVFRFTAKADDKAYMVNTQSQFGIVDLNTGAFTLLGSMGNIPPSSTPAGLAKLGDTLYTAGYTGGTLFKVNATSGALTPIGSGSIHYYALGSTTTGLYAINTYVNPSNNATLFNLYSVSPTSGIATLVGPLGPTVGPESAWGLSTGSDTLYLGDGAILYSINTTTGAAAAIGSSTSSYETALVYEDGILYAGVNACNPPCKESVWTLSASDGSATLVASTTNTSNFVGLAPLGSLFDLTQGATVLSNSAVQCGAAANIFGGATLCASDGENSLVFADSTPGSVDFVFFETPSPIELNNVQLFAHGDSGSAVQNGGLPREFAEFRFLQVDSSGNPIKTLVDFTPLHPESAGPDIPVVSAFFPPVMGQYFRAEWVQGNYALTGPRIESLQGFLASAPSIRQHQGVISAGAYGAFSSVAPGSWIEVYGTNLAADSRSWAAADFNGMNAPTSLDKTQVTVGGSSAFIDYINPGQVNAQVPSGIGTGQQPVIVTTAVGSSASYNVTVNELQPGLLAPASFNINGTQYAVALFPDGVTYVLPPGAIAGLPSQQARSGDTITFYGIGFGSVAPDTPAGQVVQGVNELTAPLQIFFGGVPATVNYAGLAPDYVGLYQFNVVVPSVAASDAVPLTFMLGGASGSQTLFIAVRN